jgi:hypothetical protein
MDLYTFRHLATDLLVYQNERLEIQVLCFCENYLHACSKMIDHCVVDVLKVNSISTPHCRDVVTT